MIMHEAWPINVHNGTEVETVHSGATLNLATYVTESVLGSDRVQSIEYS